MEDWRSLSFEEREQIRNERSSFHLISLVSNLLSRGITEIEDDNVPERQLPLLKFKLSDLFSQDIKDTLKQIEEEDLQKRTRRDILGWGELTMPQRQQDQNNIENRYDIASLDPNLQTLIREIQEQDQQEIRQDILSWSQLTMTQRQQNQNDIENRYDIAILDPDLQTLIRDIQEKDQQEMDKFPFEWKRTRRQSACDDYDIEKKEVLWV